MMISDVRVEYAITRSSVFRPCRRAHAPSKTQADGGNARRDPVVGDEPPVRHAAGAGDEVGHRPQPGNEAGRHDELGPCFSNK
jgi:hypothetical protein